MIKVGPIPEALANDPAVLAWFEEHCRSGAQGLKDSAGRIWWWFDSETDAAAARIRFDLNA